jgi:hypothetical protein
LLTGEGADAGEIAREAEKAIGALLGGGGQAQLLERVDADTAVRLLGDAERIRVWVDLLRVQGDAVDRTGAVVEAQRVRERAAALEAAASRLAASMGT